MTKIFKLFTLMLFGLFGHQSVNAQCQVTNVTADGDALVVNTCPQDGNPDVVTFSNNNASGSDYAYAITDANGSVLEIITDSSFDFDPAPAGNCFVWGFSYTGNLIGQSGGNVFSLRLSDGCYSISQNAISVVRQSPDGGTVATPTGETSVYECLQSGVSNFVGFSNTSSSSVSYRYVITDEQNNILGLPPTAFLDFAPAGPGVCRVWGLSYTGNIIAQMGDNAATVALSDNCFELSSNFITVSRGEVDGGQVSMPNGNTYRETIAQDGNADVVMFVNTSTASTSDYAYAITDANNEILLVTTDDSFDFDPVPSGTCRIWGFSYTGDITAVEGESVFATQFSTGCFDISSTAITVYRRENAGGATIDGGMVSMPSGATEKFTCTQDGNADITMLQTTSTATANYAYVVTDDQNIILAFPPSNMVDTDGAPPGACRVWGVSYTGDITAMAGDDAATVAISDGTFELSSNFVTIYRDVPNGGTVTTIDGGTDIRVLAGDGVDDIYEFAVTGTSNSNFTYVITDDQNNILGIPPSNSQNFEGAGPGVCRVWGLSYTGNITAVAGDNAAMVDLSDDCFDLSDNYISVTRIEEGTVDGGYVSMPSGATEKYTCTQDGNADITMLQTNSVATVSYAYVVTDDQNTILAFPPSNMVDTDGAPPGACRVWGVSYTGDITAQMGDDAAAVAISDGMFDLSDNWVTINRDVPEGGTVATVDGETEITITAGDGIDDIVEFMSMGTSNSNFTYVITDDQNNILGIPPANAQNFEGAGSGVCRVWGLSYTGNITAAAGDNAAMVDLTDDCFDLSDNYIEVTREAMIDGGMVSMPSGATEKYTCTQDGNADITMLQTTSLGTSNYAYVVTDDQNIILAFPPSNMVDTDGAPPGACRVWGVSYTGNITAQAGDDAAAVAISDGQFELSTNFVTINRDVPNGGTVATITGETSISIIAGDGMDDVIEFMSTGTSNSNFTYVITDDQNNILGIPPANAQNFEGAGVGVCRVWGLSYTGTITAQAGDNAADIELSDDCFNLSENFIEVNRLAAKPVSVINFAKAKVSPNPIIDQMNLELDLKDVAAEEMTNVSVYNATGNRVYNQQFQTSEGANNFQMNLGYLQAGIYKIVLQNGQRYSNVTFVKNRM